MTTEETDRDLLWRIIKSVELLRLDFRMLLDDLKEPSDDADSTAPTKT